MREVVRKGADGEEVCMLQVNAISIVISVTSNVVKFNYYHILSSLSLEVD